MQRLESPPSDLVESLLHRGLAGTPADLRRGADLALAVLRYGHDCLTDDDHHWLDEAS